MAINSRNLERSNNGTVRLFAVAGAVVGIVLPVFLFLSESLGNLEERLVRVDTRVQESIRDQGMRLQQALETIDARLQTSITSHAAIVAHPNAAERLAAIEVSFQEVETQFKGLRDLVEARQNAIKEFLEAERIAGDTIQAARLDSLRQQMNARLGGLAAPFPTIERPFPNAR